MAFVFCIALAGVFATSQPVYAADEPAAPVITKVGDKDVTSTSDLFGVPAAFKNEPYFLQITATGTAPLVFSANTTGYNALPAGLSIDSATGLISGTPTTTGSSIFTVTVSNEYGSQSVSCSISIVDETARPTITTTQETINANNYYSNSLASIEFNVTSNAPGNQYTWSISGNIPTGLAFTGSGTAAILQGIPTATGTYNVTVTVVTPFGTDSKDYTINIIAGLIAPTILDESDDLPTAVVGVPYEYQIRVSGTNTTENPITFRRHDATPDSEGNYEIGAGLKMSSSGKIFGTPELDSWLQNNSNHYSSSISNIMVYAKNSQGEALTTFQIRLYRNGVITAVVMETPTISIQKGATKQLNYTLEGYGTISDNGAWRIWLEPTSENTTISETGLLTVGEDETLTSFKVFYDAKKWSDATTQTTSGTVEVTVADHTHTIVKVNGVEPTCTTNGTAEHFKCTACGTLFSDALGENIVTSESLTLPVAHNHASEWSKNETHHWHECECGDKADNAEHVYTDDQDTTCNTCSYTRIVIKKITEIRLGGLPKISTSTDVGTLINNIRTDLAGITELVSRTTFPKIFYTHGYTQITVNSSFEDDKKYFVYWIVHPAEGYEFADDISIYVGSTKLIGNQSAATYTGYQVGDIEGKKTIWIMVELQWEQPQAHAHVWSPYLSKNDTHHWYNCTEAGCPITDNSKKSGYEAHNYNKQITTDTYKATDATCTAKATYYYSCTCGAKGTTTFEHGEVIAHNHATEWSKDANGHWHECACGDKANNAAHVYTDGQDTTCDVCGYERTVTPVDPVNPVDPVDPNLTDPTAPTEPTEPTKKDGLSGGAIAGIAVGGVALAGVGGFAIFWFVIKKKSFAELIVAIKAIF